MVWQEWLNEDYLRVNTTKDKKMVKLKEIERDVANIQDSNINIILASH